MAGCALMRCSPVVCNDRELGESLRAADTGAEKFRLRDARGRRIRALESAQKPAAGEGAIMILGAPATECARDAIITPKTPLASEGHSRQLRCV